MNNNVKILNRNKMYIYIVENFKHRMPETFEAISLKTLFDMTFGIF